MPNLHDIDRRIRSVKSTRQITRTMQMVAAAKIRHSTERVEAATPYSDSMMEMLTNVAAQTSGNESQLLVEHADKKNVLIVVVVSDRGLAGGFNSNVLRKAESILKEKRAQGAEVSVIACGKKALGYFRYRKVEPVMEFKDLSADPTVEEANEISAYAIDKYVAGELDEVVIIYNHAKNAAEQVLRVEKVLPVDVSTLTANKKQNEETVASSSEFEPDAGEVLDSLLPAYVRTTVYHALIDSAAGEQAARRSAMKSATDNANEMVDTLTRIYNRVRQGAITTEINEIVGGAAALEE
ncbi:MAG: ATP synthase F1 subunit gamma [Eggerthellaceae bacterium]|nr:ATP synthase F1 subunit gamma [Eggerthellaceae bacterium]